MSATVPKQDSVRSSSTWQSKLIITAYFLVAAGALLQWWWLGRPVALPNAPTDRLDCVSYTPPREARASHGIVPIEQIETDLKILSARTKCVRTYSVTGGLEQVPAVARKLGLRVLLGIWISSTPKDNEREIERAIVIAQQYPNTVHSIIVGNEVLLRHEQTASELAVLLERVRLATGKPVTYADVWEFWLRHPELAPLVSYITVHILPYWEDNPVSIDQALQHVADVYSKVQKAFPEKQILIGETGWPSAGRPRDGAVPSLVNEARFIREFVAFAAEHKIPYNIIEGYDQPWKRLLEGTVGGYWGLFDADGQEKFTMSGAVANEARWRDGMIAALIGAVLFTIASLLLRPRVSLRAVSFAALAGYAAGATVVSQYLYLLAANRDRAEWVGTLLWSISGWIAFISISFTLVRWLDRGGVVRSPADALAIVGSWGYGRKPPPGANRVLGLARLIVLLGVAYACAGLIFAPRYRDFPLQVVELPILAFVALEFLRFTASTPERSHANAIEEALLASWLVIAAVGIVIGEGLENIRALVWSALCLLLAASVLVPFYVGTRKHQSAEQQADPGDLEPI